MIGGAFAIFLQDFCSVLILIVPFDLLNYRPESETLQSAFDVLAFDDKISFLFVLFCLSTTRVDRKQQCLCRSAATNGAAAKTR